MQYSSSKHVTGKPEHRDDAGANTNTGVTLFVGGIMSTVHSTCFLLFFCLFVFCGDIINKQLYVISIVN